MNYSLYFITDSTGFDKDEFLKRIQDAIDGGVSVVQLREKDKTTAEYIDIATEVHSLTKKHNIPLIIDDRVDVALAVNSEGVHLGANDMPISTARAILGKGKIIGATAKTVARAEQAAAEGADYLGVGAIYPTATKVKTQITSVDTLHDICKSVDIPVCAIGGLNKDNIGVLANSGISGICVVSAIMKADNPRAAAEELLLGFKNLN